jgi:hypothetical protein
MQSVRVLNGHPDNVAYHLPLTIKLCRTITENFERSKNEAKQNYMHKNISLFKRDKSGKSLEIAK